jgi:Tol biopolymer transport system component
MEKNLLAAVIAILSVASCRQVKEIDFPDLVGPYLGQKLPGTIPEVFAPGIVSTGLYTRDIAISKDGTEIYFCISDPAATAILVTKLIDNRWTEPVIAPFSGKGFFDFEPHITPDGTKFFFLSNRPPPGKEAKPGWLYQKIWMMNRTETGWSEPQMVEGPISSENNEFFPSVTNEQVLYFTRSAKDGIPLIYRSVYKNSSYEKPEKLPFAIPETGMLFNAFISPKEDFLITCAQGIDSTNIDQDYYISFRSPDGKWSNLIKFGPDINTPGDNANSAFVSPDGKFLFFSSSRKDPALPEIKSGTSLRDIIKTKSTPGNGSSAIYWVDAKLIQELRVKELK